VKIQGVLAIQLAGGVMFNPTMGPNTFTTAVSLAGPPKALVAAIPTDFAPTVFQVKETLSVIPPLGWFTPDWLVAVQAYEIGVEVSDGLEVAVKRHGTPV
jgi:hypothetical protein